MNDLGFVADAPDVGFVPEHGTEPAMDVGFVPSVPAISEEQRAADREKFGKLLDSTKELRDLTDEGAVLHYGWKGLKYAGKVVRGLTEDVAEIFRNRKNIKLGTPITQNLGTDEEPYYLGQNIGAAAVNETPPTREKIKDVKGWEGTLAKSSGTVAEMLPSLAASGGLTTGLRAAGMAEMPAQMTASGIAFGSDEEGNFDPKQALLMSLAPGAGKLGGKIAVGALSKSGIDLASETALKAVEQSGSFLGAQTYFDLLSSPEYWNATPEQRVELWAHNFSVNALLHIPGAVGLAHGAVDEHAYEKAFRKALTEHADDAALLGTMPDRIAESPVDESAAPTTAAAEVAPSNPGNPAALPTPPAGITVSPEQWAEMATLNEADQVAKYGTSRARLFEQAAVAKAANEKELPAQGDDVTNRQQSNVPSAESPDETLANAQRVARGTSARKIFDSETAMNGPDILSWISENMRLASKTEARASRGKDWWQSNQSLYDDSTTLQRPHHNIIYGGKSMPDQVAQAAHDAGVLKSPDVPELWRAIREASERRAKAFATQRSQEAALKKEIDEHESWMKATAQGEKRVAADELKVGDHFEVDGERVKVSDIDPDSGDVTLEDGKKFGTQRISSGQTIHVEKFQEGPRDDLFGTEEMPFNLAGEKQERPPEPSEFGGYAGEKLAQSEMFAIHQITELKDPAKSALAAEKLYGGSVEAARVLERQLAVIDSDKEVARAFKKEQRERLKEVVALLRQRASKRGSAVGDPLGAPAAPAIPPPTPASGTTMLFDARLPVTMNRTKPGSVSIPEIMSALETVQRVAGSDAGNIRVRHFLQRARGIFKPHEEIIRLSSADNIPTAVHEVGHALQKQLYGTAYASGLRALPGAVKRELIGLGKALYGSTKPAAGYSGEGFAEFMRYYLTTEDAGKVAPHTLKYFEEQVLPADPDVAKALHAARTKIDVWRHQGAEERARRQVVREPGAFSRAVKSLAHFVGYQSQFESFAPIEAVARAAEKRLGRSLAASENPFMLASWKRGSAGATVERMATTNMIDVWGNPTGPSLAEALAPVKGQRNEFLLYLFARRAIERWGEKKNPGIPMEDAQHLKALYDKPEFQLAAQKYYDWWDGVLDYVAQADPTTVPLIRKIKLGSSDYAPLARMIDPLKAKALASRAQSNPLLRMSGSGLPVKDIFDQTFINAARLINRANRGLVTNAIVKLARVEGLGHIIEEVPRDRVRKTVNMEMIRAQLEDMGVDTSAVAEDELLEYFSWADRPKGSDPIIVHHRPEQRIVVDPATGATTTKTVMAPHWYQVDPRLYETLDGLHTYSLKESFPGVPGLGPTLDLFLGAPARLFKMGTTGLRPTFSLITNPTRDLQTLLMQTHTGNPARVAAAYPRALAGVVHEGLGGTGGPYVRAFYDLGAHMGQPLGIDISHTRRVSNELFHGRTVRVVLNPLDHLRQLFSLTEAGPRVAELKVIADDVGWKPGTPITPDQAVQMALAAKRVTVDFSAAGDASRVLNAALPFYNPALQGMRRFAGAVQSHPLRTSLLAMSLFTAPALLNWWRNKDQEWYRAMPWRERYLYNHVDDGKNIWKIPRTQEWGMAFQTFPEAMFDAWYQHDPQAVKEALGVMFDSVNPLDYPVPLKAAKEQWQNRIDYFDRPIVPRGEEDLPPSMQAGPYTSKASRELNKVFPNLSPRRVDAFLHSFLGGAGPEALSLVGMGAPKSDREAEPSDFPVFGVLIRRGGQFNANNQHVTDFYEAYLPVRAQVEGFNTQKRRSMVGGGEMPEAPDASVLVREKVGAEYSKFIRLYTTMATASTNRAERTELYRLAGEWAKDGLAVMKANKDQ